MRGAGHIYGVLWVDWENFSAMSTEHLISALKKINNEEKLNGVEKQASADFADLFISCSLKKKTVTENIVKCVAIHHHTKTCRKYCPKCRFNFPRFPLLRTLILEPVRMIEPNIEKQKELLKRSKQIKDAVIDILEDKEKMKEIQSIRRNIKVEVW